MALMAISAAGFGLRIGWEDDEVPPGHKFSFKRSIQSIDTGIFIKLLCPKWLVEWGPIELIREARDGFSEFQASPLSKAQRWGADATCAVVSSGIDQ